MLAWPSIEQGLDRFLELVRADPRVREEFERSRGEFFSGAASRGSLDQLRHLEWFLLERPSSALGSTPAQAWQERWRAELPVSGGELVAALLHSIPGAFEVSSLVPSEGLWVRDLFTLGEHPVAEAGAATNLAVGDMLVGRLFPAGAGTFLLSPSVSVFRNPALLAAVRRDLEEMRAVRRGVLRVQQLELERIFHRPGAVAVVPGTEEVRARVASDLRRQGLTPKVVAGLLERVKAAARTADGRVITDILNGLAFETGVDLSQTRLALIELWDSERGPPGAQAGQDPASTGSEADARAALAAFDRGRSEGKDLEQLFRELERDLGLDESEEPASEEQDEVPDFSGVIAAVVEEFLWDAEREQGAERAKRWSVLRTLGNYGRDIGVFEELGSARLLDFTRWILDESGLAGVAEVETLLEALTSFCQWCEERHDLPLWHQFGSTLDSLRTSLPRHLALRRDTPVNAGRGTYLVVRVGEREALIRDGKGRERAVALTEHQAAHLRN